MKTFNAGALNVDSGATSSVRVNSLTCPTFNSHVKAINPLRAHEGKWACKRCVSSQTTSLSLPFSILQKKKKKKKKENKNNNINKTDHQNITVSGIEP